MRLVHDFRIAHSAVYSLCVMLRLHCNYSFRCLSKMIRWQIKAKSSAIWSIAMRFVIWRNWSCEVIESGMLSQNNVPLSGGDTSKWFLFNSIPSLLCFVQCILIIRLDPILVVLFLYYFFLPHCCTRNNVIESHCLESSNRFVKRKKEKKKIRPIVMNNCHISKQNAVTLHRKQMIQMFIKRV